MKFSEPLYDLPIYLGAIHYRRIFHYIQPYFCHPPYCIIIHWTTLEFIYWNNIRITDTVILLMIIVRQYCYLSIIDIYIYTSTAFSGAFSACMAILLQCNCLYEIWKTVRKTKKNTVENCTCTCTPIINTRQLACPVHRVIARMHRYLRKCLPINHHGWGVQWRVGSSEVFLYFLRPAWSGHCVRRQTTV